MKRVKQLVPILLVLSLLACATLGLKPYTEMSPKEKMSFIFSSYNKQYEDYKLQAARTNLTDADKNILRTKKEILVKVYPLIQIADLALVEGKPWDVTLENTIIGYLRQLGAKIQ